MQASASTEVRSRVHVRRRFSRRQRATLNSAGIALAPSNAAAARLAGLIAASAAASAPAGDHRRVNRRQGGRS